MDKTFGFIGTGNMGGALARAVAKAVPTSQIMLADQCAEKAAALAAELGCRQADAQQVARECSFVFLGVKPQVMPTMLCQISQELILRKTPVVLVSMAAGISMEDIKRLSMGSFPVIRIMPNIPVSVGGGMILFDATEDVAQADIDLFCQAMQYAGALDRLPEKLIDAGSALSGCGPAFVSLFVEALADGAVACGLPRDKALVYAAQTAAGTAKMLLESGLHPGELKDAVCSPGGSTIAGVQALEESAFRAGAINAVTAAYERTLELGK